MKRNLILLIVVFCTYYGDVFSLEFNARAPCFRSDSLKTSHDVRYTKKFTMDDSWVSTDKYHHALVSTFIMSSLYFFERENLNISNQAAISVSVSTTMAIGLGKELLDKRSRHGVASYKDLIADLIGIGVGYLLFVRD